MLTRTKVFADIIGHLTDDEIVLLVMVYAKAVQANVKPTDIKRG